MVWFLLYFILTEILRDSGLVGMPRRHFHLASPPSVFWSNLSLRHHHHCTLKYILIKSISSSSSWHMIISLLLLYWSWSSTLWSWAFFFFKQTNEVHCKKCTLTLICFCCVVIFKIFYDFNFFLYTFQLSGVCRWVLGQFFIVWTLYFFLAMLVALHFTPVGETIHWNTGSLDKSFEEASRLASLLLLSFHRISWCVLVGPATNTSAGGLLS